MEVALFIAHAKDAFDVEAIVFVYMLLSTVIFVLSSGNILYRQVVF